MVAAPAAVAMVWKWLFNSEFGLINYLLQLVGIQGPQWVSDPNFALIAIAIVGIWSAIGYKHDFTVSRTSRNSKRLL